MASNTSLIKEINQYLPSLSEQQKTAVLSVVKTFAEDGNATLNNKWDDTEFIKFLDERVKAFENGTVKGVPLVKVNSRINKKLKVNVK